MNDFEIPLGPVSVEHLNAVFSSDDFKRNFALQEPTPQNQKPAERFMRNALKPYDFHMPATEEQWRNFVLSRWYQMADDPDPKIAKSALDSIAKSCVANLMVERKEINITTRSDEELNKELKDLFASLKAKASEKVIEGTAVRA